MRRVAVAGVALVAGLGIPVATAQATFHLEQVNEVMLASASGDSSTQFVELLDKGGSEEQFTPVFAPYKLVVYDGAGKELGEQTLNPTGLRNAAAAGSEYLISTPAADAAFGVTGDERLTVSLPLDAAQACFAGNPGNISCITYGSIASPVPMNSNGSGAQHGPVPPNGESDQRQPDGSIQAAAPTPKAPNRAGSGAPGAGGSSTPTGSGSPPGGTTTSFARVGFAARTARVDRRGRALVSLSCPSDAVGACTGRITLSAGGARAGHAAFVLPPGAHRTIKVTLSRAARRALARRGRISVRANVTAADRAGHDRSSTSALTLRR